jgi:hypothetical protein
MDKNEGDQQMEQVLSRLAFLELAIFGRRSDALAPLISPGKQGLQSVDGYRWFQVDLFYAPVGNPPGSENETTIEFQFLASNNQPISMMSVFASFRKAADSLMGHVTLDGRDSGTIYTNQYEVEITSGRGADPANSDTLSLGLYIQTSTPAALFRIRTVGRACQSVDLTLRDSRTSFATNKDVNSGEWVNVAL